MENRPFHRAYLTKKYLDVMCPFVSSFPSPLALLRSRLRSKRRRTGTSQSRESLACSKLSHSVRAFSISRTRQSRSLEQAFRGSAERRKWSVAIMENSHLVSSSGHVMFFKSFHKLYLHMRVFKRNLNETILWGNITWHEMG